MHSHKTSKKACYGCLLDNLPHNIYNTIRVILMVSGLRAKLNAMKMATPAAQPPNTARAGGVLIHAHRMPLDAQIFELSTVGLRRIGWSGQRFDIRKCLFLDTETTGLSGGAGTVAFLVGVGFVDGDAFVVEQYLMREYADESELIDRLCARMEGFDCVCTFNGKNFDMPLLEARFTMCRMRNRWRDLENIDLLYPARRAWKLRLGSCRLSRLEEIILGAPRSDDLPGSEVPGRYFEFLKTGDESLLEDIILHNRQDIATLATLLVRLCEVNDSPEKLTEQLDIFSIGRSLERQGELKPARELYRISAIPQPMGSLAALTGARVSGMANWRLYILARKCGDTEEMRNVLEQMLLRQQMPGCVCVELAKLYEHRLKNYSRALEYVRRAAQYPDSASAEALKYREERIIRKMKK